MYLQAIVLKPNLRFVIIHYHIFKNGGTTIEHILDREFPGRFATVHGRDSECVLDSDDLLEFLRKNPNVTAVSSHHLQYPKPRSRKIVFFDCCFLRDPMERLYSCYNHYRRTASNDIFARWARSYSPRDFVARLMDDFPHQVSNVQVTCLANAGTFMRPANERDLDQAIAVVRDMAIPGLVDMFEESLAAAEYFLRPAFPSLRLEFLPQNVNPFPRAKRGKMASEWRELWGCELHEHLLRMNALDLELVRRARIEILRRLESIPRVPEKLADFRLRCARLSAQPIACETPCAVPAALGVSAGG